MPIVPVTGTKVKNGAAVIVDVVDEKKELEADEDAILNSRLQSLKNG